VLLSGALVGYGAYRLSRAARQACAVLLREHPGLFDLWTWEAPLTIAAAALVGLIAWVLPAMALQRHAQRGMRLAVPAASFVLLLAAFALIHFVIVGTPTGMGSDTDACPADHVPPWWPTWLPS
jgi:hypothetical protein